MSSDNINYTKLCDFDKFKIIDREHPSGLNGFQKVYKFENGFGASVVRFGRMNGFFDGSYTNDETEVELAVLKFNGESCSITYSTPLTNDVIGHLKEKELIKTLNEIKELKQKEQEHCDRSCNQS